MNQKIKESFIFWSVPIGALLLWFLKDIFFIVVAALIFGSAIQTWALWLKGKIKIPFLLGVLVIYITLIAIFVITIYGLLPVLKQELATFLPNTQTILKQLNIQEDFFGTQIIDSISGVFSNVGPFVLNLLGGIISAVLILVLSFYFTTHINLYKNAISFLPVQNKEKVQKLWISGRKKFAFWLVGEMFLMIIIGIAVYVLMAILKVPNAALIGTIAGMTEIIPVLGPIIAASIAILVTLIETPQMIWWVIFGFFIIQQIENNVLVPMVMKKALAINPVFTLIAIMIGGAINGVLGILIVLPMVVFAAEIYTSYVE
ncbi:MAG: AI-2E family transporter [Patescibacteria group bacterium]